MNYIHLINQFWRTRRRLHLTSVTADLYYFLIHECNEQEWSNPFECPNVLILSSIGISESALSDARNRLKQLGLIDFQAGKRNEKAPVYRLVYPFKNGKTEGKQEGKEQGKTEGKHPNINKETKPKTKPKDSEPIGSGPRGVVSAKKKEATPHWQVMVKVWFEFYAEKKGEEPTFEKQEPGSMRFICGQLQKRAEKKGWPWTEETARNTLSSFLHRAYGIEWLQKNFMLHNLERQFDTIITTLQNEQGTAKNGKPATGGNVSLSSAFDTIDRMFNKPDTAQ